MRDFLKKLFSFFDRRTKFQIAGLFCVMVFTGILEMVGIGLFLPVLQLIAMPEKIASTPILSDFYAGPGQSDVARTLILGVTILFGFYLLKNTIIMFFIFVQSRFVFRKMALFSTELLRRYASRKYTFHLKRNSSEFIRNIMISTKTVFVGALLSFLELFMELFLIMGAVTALLVIEPVVTLTSAVFLGSTLGLLYLFLRNRLATWGRSIQDSQGGMILAINHCIGALKEIKVLGRIAHFVESFRSQSLAYAADRTKLTVSGQLPRLYGEVVILGGLLAVVSVTVLQGASIAETLPLLGIFGVAAMRITPSVNRVVLYAGKMRQSVAALDDLYNDFQSLSESEAADGASEPRRPMHIENAIQLVDVSFTYEGSDRPSLQNVNITIPKGGTVALVGASGAGKTTLADITLGLLQPTQGRVKIDGLDISTNLRGWQDLIGYVPQEIYLIDDTLRRNIALGIDDKNIDEAKVAGAVRMAQLELVVADMKNGLDTVVGERGIRLSGGQRQRIGIARALYHEPEVLVLDEATSSLDSETESEISRTIQALGGQRTLIIIAHRLSTVRQCDRLFYLDAGRVIDSGTFDEMLQKNDHFRRMVNLAESAAKVAVS